MFAKLLDLMRRKLHRQKSCEPESPAPPDPMIGRFLLARRFAHGRGGVVFLDREFGYIDGSRKVCELNAQHGVKYALVPATQSSRQEGSQVAAWKG